MDAIFDNYLALVLHVGSCTGRDINFNAPSNGFLYLILMSTFFLSLKGRYISRAMAYNQDGKCVAAAESDFKV